MRILFADSNHPILHETLIKAGFDCDLFWDKSVKDLMELLPGYDAVVIRSRFKINKELLDKCPQLKCVGRVGAGMENIDVKYAESKHIKCFCVPEGNRDAVGEHALGMLLMLLNNLKKADEEVRRGVWLRTENRGYEIKGKTIDETFKFNFGDLADYKLSVSKDIIKVTAKVIDNKKFVQYTKDAALQNYDNSVEFFVGDLEDARYLTEVLPAISKGCKSNITAGDFNSLASKLKTIENPKQELVLQDGGDKCKWKLTANLTESKKSVEAISEWNLYDIDAKKIEIEVSGKTVGVTAYTLNKEKFIKFISLEKPGLLSFVYFMNFSLLSV